MSRVGGLGRADPSQGLEVEPSRARGLGRVRSGQGRAYCIFNNLCEIFGSLWIYEIYVDLLVRGINRVGRYIWSKYILTDVIE